MVASSRTLKALAYLVVVLVAIDALITLAAAYGIAPRAREVIEVKAPLYARRAIHVFAYLIDFDSGMYRVSFYSESNVTIKVACRFPGALRSASLGPGEMFEVEIPCRTGIRVDIEAFLEPLQGSVGVLEVSRRWLLPGSG